MPLKNPKRLLVEGADEKRTVPELIEALGVPWGERRSEWIVEIRDEGGRSNLLDRKRLSLHLDDPSVTHLGLIVDADTDAGATYRAARGLCVDHFPALPETASGSGVIAVEGGRTFGIWIMPDNLGPGMLETFLGLLAEPDAALWSHARAATTRAVELGAPVEAAHLDKAYIHTWLAWREPPGRQLHDAIKLHQLRPGAPVAVDFLGWFRGTFALQ